MCGPLTRTQFVRYAGASHDFNPNHHDEVYAQANGNKAVFGMGMLAGGYCARLLTDWLGDGALSGCASASPRASGRATCSPARRASPPSASTTAKALVDCEFSAVNQAGEVIIRGDATAALPR